MQDSMCRRIHEWQGSRGIVGDHKADDKAASVMWAAMHVLVSFGHADKPVASSPWRHRSVFAVGDPSTENLWHRLG